MGLTFARVSLLTTLVLLACCDRPAIDPSNSLVDAKQLPPARLLSREIIQINTAYHDFGPTSPGNLTYELLPDDSLAITRTKYDSEAIKQVTVGRDTLHLGSKAAEQVRRTLWRVRPEPLQGIEYVIRPIGCAPPPIDAGAELYVGFIAEGPKPGIGDDRVGIFELPYAQYCGTRQAVDARRIVSSVLQSFPQSKVADEFHRQVKRWEAKIHSPEPQ